MFEFTKRCLIYIYFVINMANDYTAQSFQSRILLKMITTRMEKHHNAQLDNGTLRELLHQIDYLNMHLFNAQHYDIAIVQQFLHQSFCPFTLSLGRTWPKFDSNQRHRLLVMGSKDLSMNLSKYGTRDGVLINILLDHPTQSELLQLARRQWIEKGALKIYYIFPNKTGTKTFECLFFNPFQRVDTQTGVMKRLHDTSFLSIFRNLYKYPLRTYIYRSAYANVEVFSNESFSKIIKIEGADVEVTDLLAEKMNFTVDLQLPDEDFYGSRIPNGSFNGAIGRIIRFEVDIVMTGFFIKDYFTREIGFSAPVYMDELCCYVKKASRVPQSIVPLFAVHSTVLISFISVGLLCPFIWMMLRYLNLYALSNGVPILNIKILQPRERNRLIKKHKLQYIRIYIDTWVMWVRVNILSYPPFISERIFIASLCLASLIFWAIFESSLATVYIHPLHYNDINSMKQLDDANFLIYIKHGAMKDDLFYGHSSQVYKNLEKKLILINEGYGSLVKSMSKRGNFAAVTRASSLELEDIEYFVTNKLHKIPECPKNYHIAFVFPIHSPLEKNINILLLKFVQAGLIEHWIEHMKYSAKIRTRNFSGYGEMGAKWKVLTLNDLQLAFYTVMFGSALSLVAEILEYCIHYKLSKMS